MASNTIPLAIPDELLDQIQLACKQTGLSQADVMRQSMLVGLPHLKKGLSKEEDMSETLAETWEKLGPAPTVLYEFIEKR